MGVHRVPKVIQYRTQLYIYILLLCILYRYAEQIKYITNENDNDRICYTGGYDLATTHIRECENLDLTYCLCTHLNQI